MSNYSDSHVVREEGRLAYDEGTDDLLNGWVAKCEKVSANPDAKHILRQYGQLLKKLGGQAINKPIMKKFYELMLQDDNLQTALSLKSMLDELVLYRVEKIIDTFKSDLAPFERVANWHDDTAYFTNLIWKEAHFGIDVIVSPETSIFQFWDRDDAAGKKGFAKLMLRKMNCLGDYINHTEGFRKTFRFPADENALYDHIRSFKAKLTKAIAS